MDFLAYSKYSLLFQIVSFIHQHYNYMQKTSRPHNEILHISVGN
jgi:hypothetical protein